CVTTPGLSFPRSSRERRFVARVLITGGAGFIGSHVADLLLDQGHEVRIYDRLVEQVHNGHGPRHVHTAAEVGVGQSMYQITRYVDGNTSGTGVLLELLANEPHSVRRIVVASSMSVYGEGAYRCEEHG